MKTAVQQLMIGKACTSKARAAEILAEIAAAGYDAIELNGFMTRPSSPLVKLLTSLGGMPVGKCGKLDWRALISQSGLSVLALHEDLGTIEEKTDMVAEEARAFGCDKIVVTGMYKFDYSDAGAVRGLAASLDAAGRALAKRGLQLLYHNHNAEFLRYRTDNMYGKLVELTDPAHLGFELDVFWAADAGVDPLQVMDMLGSRLKLVHLTDRGARKGTRIFTPIVKQKSVELGLGNLDLVACCKKARALGVESLVLESHNNWIDGDPVRSLQVSSAFLDKWARG